MVHFSCSINRLCLKTVTINDVTIPKGVTVIIPMSLLHKSPKYWKDPEVFRPERFDSIQHIIYHSGHVLILTCERLS